MPATLPSGNWHPLLWPGSLSNLACLHVGLGGGANDSSPLSAKYPIKRLHTWHFCGAGLRSAARKWVIQAPAGQRPVIREQQGWGPSDLGWLLPSFCSPLCADWNIKEECIHPGTQGFLLGRAQKSSPVPTSFTSAFPVGGRLQLLFANLQCRGGTLSSLESFRNLQAFPYTELCTTRLVFYLFLFHFYLSHSCKHGGTLS